jgi:hypothetical protein
MSDDSKRVVRIDEGTLKKGGINREYQIPQQQRPRDPPPMKPPPAPPSPPAKKT